MRIGIIGAGAMAAALGGGWASVGHEVRIGARSSEAAKTLAARISATHVDGIGAAIEWADVVLMAVPVAALADLLGAHGTALAGKIVIDCTNAFLPDEPLPDGTTAFVLGEDAVAERIAAGAPKAHVVLAFIAVVGGLFELATRATGGVTRTERALLPIRLAHSLTPIIAGYIVAHYLSFLVEKGQTTLILCADPFGLGWNLAGLADLQVSYILSEQPGLLATIKVLAVLTGHILGVAAAHDRCLRLLPPSHRLTGQLALMLLMVGFTFLGLYLLFDA